MENTLYHYWRSSCSWRVRWALELKKIKVKYVHVDLISSESEDEPHRSRNPFGHVPALFYQNTMLIESMAIMELLDELHPNQKLFPGNAIDRTQIRILCEMINSGTQPIQNLPVLDFYSKVPEERKKWCQYFIGRGLSAYEKWASKRAGKYSFGDSITAADICLIPQCYNALRNDMNLSDFPTIQRIHAAALLTEEAQNSAPERFQPK